MKLYLFEEEKKVILALASAMLVADGAAKLPESHAIVEEALRMGVDPVSSQEEILRIKPDYAVACVSKMSDEKKKYVCSVLIKVMLSDGEAHPRETTFLSNMIINAGLPMLSPMEAKAFLDSL